MILSFLRRHLRAIVVAGVAAAVVGVNVPPAYKFIADYEHTKLINSMAYKRQYGHWDVIDLPARMRVNAVHAALLDTGKLLIIAGSGNDQRMFDAGTFKTLLYDPSTGRTKLIPTPTDLFCGGHAFLPDGKLLVAGGTQRYEILQGAVTRAAGNMIVKNESPNGAPRQFPKGTQFVGPDGKRYRATSEFTLQPAAKTFGPHGKVTVTASAENVWVEADDSGRRYVQPKRMKHYALLGLRGADTHNIYGLGFAMTMNKQDYQGRKESYEFDPVSERYVRVADMHEKRWYPTLTGLANGDVLAVSGLDGSGQITDDNEMFDPATKTWTNRPDLRRHFPTFPALFQTERPGMLFFSGSNSGYGPANLGRVPGFWNLTDNAFTPVAGLRDPDQLETSGSGWVGPVQNQKIMVVGGGGVGESPKSTGRIDIIDLKAARPRFVPGPSLPQGTRYPNLVTLPNDTTLITGGSRDYRGKEASDNHTARVFHPDTDTLTVAADPNVGRDYHTEALLLPDGRVITLGSNPLFADEKNTITAPFEQRIEIYTPAYLYHGARPTLTGGPTRLALGGHATFTTPDPGDIATARLIRPSAATHVTNLEQRSVALGLTRGANSVTVSLPALPTLVPPGPYMLFVTNRAGVPSVAKWVMVP